MARLLIDMCSKWQWRLGILHCNHRWRADSADNAAHVAELAQSWQVPVWIEVASSVPSSEAAARDWRYGAIAKVANAEGFEFVVTGHTQSDRAETVLYNLIRGTGTDGLGTLPWVRALDNLSLVRPLLHFSRQETADFCRQQHIPIWEDSTNQDMSFRRNRIRQELLPYLQEHFNPQVERALAQMAEITADETNYLNAQATALYQQCVSEVVMDASLERSQSCWHIERKALAKAPLALRRRVVKQLLERAIATSPNFFQIEKLIALLTAPNGSQSDPFPSGWIAQVKGSVVSLNLIEQPQ